MRTSLLITALLIQYASLVTSTAPAALLGPGYPAPTDLTSNLSTVPAAWSNFTAIIETYIRENQTVEGLVPNLGSYSFSIGAFSIHDTAAAEVLQYYHTGPDVGKPVDGDSLFRVESISKVFTVYLALIEIGSTYWDRPITDFLPYLAAYANKTSPDPLKVVDWESVELGALAGQIAGIPRDSPLLGSDLFLVPKSSRGDFSAQGLPPLNLSSAVTLDPCVNPKYLSGNTLACPDDAYLQALTQPPPMYSPWTTPIYTNGGFDLIALAIENATGQRFEDLY